MLFYFLSQIGVHPAMSVNADIYHFGELQKESKSTREHITSACITRNKDIQTNTRQSTSFVYGKATQQVQLFSEWIPSEYNMLKFWADVNTEIRHWVHFGHDLEPGTKQNTLCSNRIVLRFADWAFDTLKQ